MRSSLERHEIIKTRLRLAGSSLAQIARELGVAPTTVTTVSQGYRRSRRIEAAIARALRVTPQALWSDRYPEFDGSDPQALGSTVSCGGLS